MTRVLVIEDQPATREVLVDLLTHLGFDTLDAGSGAQGLKLAAESRPGMILLDLGLPDMSGMEVLRQLRTWTDVPVIVVSGSSRSRRKAEALDAGADDFLDKPFHVSELRARLRVVERRLASGQHEAMAARSYGHLVVDTLNRSVTCDGAEVRLTDTEWHLLELLSSRPGRVCTRGLLTHQVWGPHAGPEAAASLRTHIRSLRTKIGDDAHEPTYIRTESGVGYRWIAQPAAVATPGVDPLTLTTRFVDELGRSLTSHGHVPDPELEALTEQLLAAVRAAGVRDATGTS